MSIGKHVPAVVAREMVRAYDRVRATFASAEEFDASTLYLGM